MLAIVGAGAAASAGLLSVSARLMATAAAAAPVVGPSTLKLIDALQKAGPEMDSRISAVSRWLPSGQKAIISSLEGGAKMLSGGAGARARQVILNTDGSTVVKAFNVSKKTYEVVQTITPATQ